MVEAGAGSPNEHVAAAAGGERMRSSNVARVFGPSSALSVDLRLGRLGLWHSSCASACMATCRVSEICPRFPLDLLEHGYSKAMSDYWRSQIAAGAVSERWRNRSVHDWREAVLLRVEGEVEAEYAVDRLLDLDDLPAHRKVSVILDIH